MEIQFGCERALVRVGLRALLGAASLAALMSVASIAAAATAGDQPQPPPGDAPAAAGAQSSTSLPEIIVEATRREEDIQKVPLAVTAFTSERLQTLNIDSPADLEYYTPSLIVTGGAMGQFNGSYIIRGLGPVAVYVDDAPCCSSSTTVSFLDIASVQVVNGPQGTLFGKNGAGGAILIQPQLPVMNNFGGFVDGIIGDYGRADLSGAINIPLITDHLALRIAASENHTDGYVSQFGYSYNSSNGLVTVPASSQKLDEINNQTLRIELQFDLGHFSNNVMANFFNADQSPQSESLAGYYNGNSELAAFSATATLDAECAAQVSYGLSPSLTACQTQRKDIIAAIEAEEASETSRLATGGRSAVLSQPAPFNGLAETDLYRHIDVVDVAQYDFGDVFFSTHLKAKNIFSFQDDAGTNSLTADGVGGMIESAAYPEGGPSGSFGGAAQESGTVAYGVLAAPVYQFSDEFQIQGDYDQSLVTWTVGGIYIDGPYQNETGYGPIQTNELVSGLSTPYLGYNGGAYEYGGGSREWAGYGQATIDFSRFGLHGLKLTGGYRYTWDWAQNVQVKVVQPFAAATNTAASCSEAGSTTGAYLPSYCPATGAYNVIYGAVSSTQGANYLVSLNEQFTDDLMGYLQVSHAFIPGGYNTALTVLYVSEGYDLPNYTPTYAAEAVQNYELGAKYDFSVLGMKGRLDAAVYYDQFTNIPTGYSGSFLAPGNPALPPVVTAYTETAAAAALKGAELQATFLPTSDWTIIFSGDYEDVYFTKYVASDPYGLATYAKPGPGETCVAGSLMPSGTSTGSCLINLANSQYPYTPKFKGSLTVQYHVPFDEKWGRLTLSATAFAQSSITFNEYGPRLQLVLPSLASFGVTTNPNQYGQPAYATLNLRADWNNINGSHWNAAAFVTNVTDQLYATAGATSLLTLGFEAKTYAAPRMFGFELSRKF